MECQYRRPNLIGKYTCKNTAENGNCSTLYLVESYYNISSAYVIPLDFTSHYSIFGLIQFNEDDASLADVGYMYNTRYTYNGKSIPLKYERMYSSSLSLSTTYWYADSVTWGSPTANNYNLNDPYQVSTTEDYTNLVGKYTFRSTSQSYADSGIYYIAAVKNDTMYYIYLKNGNNISDYNYTYTFGDSYIDNGDGTYTINNPTTINRTDWLSYSRNTVDNYVCKNATNNTCSDIWYVSYTSDTIMTYLKKRIYKYASGFTYDEDTDTYTLNSDSISIWGITKYENKLSLSNHHYTCWNETGSCTRLSYVYSIESSHQDSNTEITPYYVELTGGKSINDILEEMLNNNDVNQINSIIKTGLEAWYKKYLLDYDSNIEDTIFCSNRSITNLGGWNPDGGSPMGNIGFNKNDLSCDNNTDKFSVSNNKAPLKYKVGLISSPEMKLLNNRTLQKTGARFWLISPGYYYDHRHAEVGHVRDIGGVFTDEANSYNGVRPTISLNSLARTISGTGSKESPYRLSFEPIYSYSVNVEIKNETEDLNIELDDLTSVEEGEEVKFNVKPIKGYKVNTIKVVDENNNEINITQTNNKNEYTFIMPTSDVTIKPSYERVINGVYVEDNKNTKELIIEVNDVTAVVYEDTVKFTIVPEDGYELEDIDIRDKDNNKIEYTKTNKDNEYMFIMPDTDVVIKPLYRKLDANNNDNSDSKIIYNILTNPKTGERLYILLSLMSIIAIGTLFYRKAIKLKSYIKK